MKKQPKKITELKLCFTVSVMHSSIFLLSLKCLMKTLLLSPHTSNLLSSFQRTLFHCSAVYSVWEMAPWNLLRLLAGRRSGFRTEMRLCKPTSGSRRFPVLRDFSQRSLLKSAVFSETLFLFLHLFNLILPPSNYEVLWSLSVCFGSCKSVLEAVGW